MSEFEEGVDTLIQLFHQVRRDLCSDVALGRDVNTFQMFPGQGEGRQDMLLEVVCLSVERRDKEGGPFAPEVRQLTVAYRPVGESPMYEVEARLEMIEGLTAKELLLRSPDVFHLVSFSRSVAEEVG